MSLTNISYFCRKFLKDTFKFHKNKAKLDFFFENRSDDSLTVDNLLKSVSLNT